jgi:hypothetical protein
MKGHPVCAANPACKPICRQECPQDTPGTLLQGPQTVYSSQILRGCPRTPFGCPRPSLWLWLVTREVGTPEGASPGRELEVREEEPGAMGNSRRREAGDDRARCTSRREGTRGHLWDTSRAPRSQRLSQVSNQGCRHRHPSAPRSAPQFWLKQAKCGTLGEPVFGVPSTELSPRVSATCPGT